MQTFMPITTPSDTDSDKLVLTACVTQKSCIDLFALTYISKDPAQVQCTSMCTCWKVSRVVKRAVVLQPWKGRITPSPAAVKISVTLSTN